MFEGEREGEWGGGAKVEGERVKPTLPWPPSQHGAQFNDLEIRTWAEMKGQMLNQLCYPGAPVFHLFDKLKYIFSLQQAFNVIMISLDL